VPAPAAPTEAAAPAAPNPASGVRLSRPQAHVTGGSHGDAAPAPQRNIPIRNLAAPPPKRKSPVLKYATVVCTLAALGVGGYFGYFWFRGMQEKANAKRDTAEQNSGGGESGRQRGGNAAIPVATEGNTNAAGGTAADNQPIVPAVWTLDVGTAKIPEGKVNGMVSGTNFVLETARLDPVGSAQVLRLVQGQLLSPDREVLVYLHLKPGEKLGGQSLAISQGMTGSGVPQVAKRWKPNAKFAPQLKSFYNGYAMKLELGQVADNVIPGKIFLALPDTEQTVVAGVFKAAVAVIDANAAAAATAAAAPTAPAADDAAARQAAQDAFRRRYGTRQ